MAMRVLILTGIAAVAATGAAFADSQSFDQIERGRYLATLSDCAACHTASGGKPYAGGLHLQTPFGTIVSSNITPDRETGIGDWTKEEFLSAVREGRGHNGTRLYPAMPYTAYTKMTDDDVLAIRAYLATLAPVSSDLEPVAIPAEHSSRHVGLERVEL
jgi:mono/diheme cytochrome c family protein